MPKLSEVQKKELAKYKRLANSTFYAHKDEAKRIYNQLRKMYGLK